MNRNLIWAGAALAAVYLAYRLTHKPTAASGNTAANSSATGPADWVKSGSQQDLMLAAQNAGLV
ncbi:MAG: hypothetical protein PHX38_02775 [Sulfuricella sp.]|nr:hypothetical protein [Sulfuricella sp.]